jgi:hypothetical protein
VAANRIAAMAIEAAIRIAAMDRMATAGHMITVHIAAVDPTITVHIMAAVDPITVARMADLPIPVDRITVEAGHRITEADRTMAVQTMAVANLTAVVDRITAAAVAHTTTVAHMADVAKQR